MSVYRNIPSEFISPKHNPRMLPSASSAFRSVVSEDCVANPQKYLDYALASGTAMYSSAHNSTGIFFQTPSWLHCGSAISAGIAMPGRAMDGYYIARAYSDRAHIYAEDKSRIEVLLAAGKIAVIPM